MHCGSSELLIDAVGECFEFGMVVYHESITFVAFREGPKSFDSRVGIGDDICFYVSVCGMGFHENTSHNDVFFLCCFITKEKKILGIQPLVFS